MARLGGGISRQFLSSGRKRQFAEHQMMKEKADKKAMVTVFFGGGDARTGDLSEP